MANNATKSPIIVDTTGANPVHYGPLTITKIRWVGATTAGHQAVVNDRDGRTVWESVAPGGNYVEADTLFDTSASGIVVPTLGSGKLYIYYK